MDSSSSKKPRASRPKVKTGCITCKQRRVKCDETKPECLRCSNFGRKCAGYPSKEESPPVKEMTLPVPRRLLSKAMQSSPSSSRSPSPSAIPLHARVASVARPLMPPGVVFQDEREYQYFCHFRDETSVELAAGFEPGLWNSLVLQACDNPSILRLTVATAALSLAKAPHSSSPDFEKDAHHQHALQQYGEALKGIREMVAMGQDSLRIALISALLIFCFESMHGDLGRAIAHVQSALDMIVKRISDSPRSYYFTRVNTIGRRGSGATIDDDLLTAFMRLDRPSLTLLSKRKENAPLLTTRIFTLLFSEEHLEIPRGFATIGEARIYLEDLKWRVLTTTQPPDTVKAFWEEDLDETSSPDLGSFPFQLKQWYEGPGVLNSSSNFALEFAHWHDAFSPLLNYAMSPAGEPMFIGAVTLH
ncbi:Transcriptional regulatory protein moc3, partial [Lachnellula suecica]